MIPQSDAHNTDFPRKKKQQQQRHLQWRARSINTRQIFKEYPFSTVLNIKQWLISFNISKAFGMCLQKNGIPPGMNGLLTFRTISLILYFHWRWATNGLLHSFDFIQSSQSIRLVSFPDVFVSCFVWLQFHLNFFTNTFWEMTTGPLFWSSCSTFSHHHHNSNNWRVVLMSFFFRFVCLWMLFPDLKPNNCFSNYPDVHTLDCTLLIGVWNEKGMLVHVHLQSIASRRCRGETAPAARKSRMHYQFS